MPQHQLSASALILAPATKVYGLIADYRNGHPRILPKPYFETLTIKEGGVGAGTVIDFQMRLMGQLRNFHAVITEPQPGRVLVETDTAAGSVTTFTVEPRAAGQQAFVTITTTLPVRAGLLGKIEGWMMTQMLQPIYVKELAQLAEVAAQAP